METKVTLLHFLKKPALGQMGQNLLKNHVFWFHIFFLYISKKEITCANDWHAYFIEYDFGVCVFAMK